MRKVNRRTSLPRPFDFAQGRPGQKKVRTGRPLFVSRRGANMKPKIMVRSIYRALAGSWGPQHWWPAETPFEVSAGAILTQIASWKNVERALGSLRSANALSLAGIRALPLPRLEELV